MEMHQIRYFLAVAETLNFTRAAEQCHVAQPSLTRAIKKLEEELGGLLFRRERNLTHLTELGLLMRPHLESIYAASEAARAEALGYCRQERAPLKLGVMCTISPTRLVSFFDDLRTQIRTLDLEVHEAAGTQLVEDLESGEVDVALVGLPEYPERCDARPLFTERYTIAFRKGHRFEAMNAIPLKELDGEDYLQRIHCEFRYHFEALRVTNQPAVKVRYRSEREDWIQAMILAGMGCAVMPEYLPMLPGLATRVIVDPEVTRTIQLVSIAGRRFSPTVQAAIRMALRYDWTMVM